MPENELSIKVCRFICDWEPDITINSVDDWLKYVGSEYCDRYMKESTIECAKARYDEMMSFINNEVIPIILN